MPRTISLAVALVGAVAASQAPEFAQQYRQRLGGAIDELQSVVSRFDEDATAQGLDRRGALERLGGNTDPLARARADAASVSITRLDRLSRQRDAMAEAGPVGRIVSVAADPDPLVARRALEAFEPAIPTTGEGLLVAGLGFLGSYGLVRLMARPFRHLRRRPAGAAPGRVRV